MLLQIWDIYTRKGFV